MDNLWEINTLEECLVALGSKQPFLKQIQINSDECVEVFTKSGAIAYEKLRAIIFFLNKQSVIDKINEDLLDNIADMEW